MTRQDHLRKIAADTRLLVGRYVVACQEYLDSSGYPGLSVVISYHNALDIPRCIYRSPNRLSINLMRCAALSSSELKDYVLDCMASCGMHRQYSKQVEAHRCEIIASKRVKAYLHPYGSEAWASLRIALAQRLKDVGL